MLVELTVEQIKKLRAKKTETINYKTVDGIGLPMKLYYPDGHTLGGKYGAIVCIHGGSWRAVNDNSPWDGGIMSPQAECFAALGAVGITISYRDFPPPEDARTPGGRHITLYDLYIDCRDAIRFLKKNACRFGIDPDRIAVIGDSAGGHLAGCLATIDNDEEDGRISAAVMCNPITDLTDPSWHKYIECVCKDDAESEAKKVSPLYRVKENCVPVLLMHGLEDTCVLPRHSMDFYEKSKKMGNRCNIQLFPDTEHAFIIFNYTASDEQIEKAMHEAVDFLVDIGSFTVKR